MSSIFLSYGRHDQEFVDRLAASLTDKDHFVYVDRMELVAGDTFTDDLPKAIADADYVVVILSEHSYNSVWVAFETGIAKAGELAMPGRKKIVPVCYGTVELPGFLSGRHALTFNLDGGNHEAQMENLFNAVEFDREGGPRIADAPRTQGPETLTLFKTQKQTTRLERNSEVLQCYLHDTREGRGGLQWTMPLDQAQRIAKSGDITADPRAAENKAGFLNIGPRKRWFYSKQLFPGEPQGAVKAVRAFILAD